MGNFYVSGYFQLGTKTQSEPYELFRSKNWYTLEAGVVKRRLELQREHL